MRRMALEVKQLGPESSNSPGLSRELTDSEDSPEFQDVIRQRHIVT